MSTHHMATIAALGAILALLSCACAKSGRNYYTDERLAWMEGNLERYEWAQKERDNIIARADRWVGYDDDRLCELVPPLEVARCGTVHNSGCPVHGEKILKHPGGRKSWKMSFDRMYKIQCPEGGEWYPSNDFYAYLKSGCEDTSLLEGEHVDDGWGCELPGHAKKFWFVGYFAGQMVRRWLLPAIENMSKAYLITGDQRYAHKTAALLWKLSQYYPDYNYETQSRYGLEFQSGYRGRLQYHTWECFTLHTVTLAYDAIYPAIAGDEGLEEFTRKDAARIRSDIEDRMLRVAARDITDGSHRIQGNYGMHQSALLRIALVLDSDEGEQTSEDMVNWVLQGPPEVTIYTDTALPDAIVNLLHRDGMPFESPSYSCGWMTHLEDVAELLLLNGVDFWEMPRFQGLYRWPLKFTVCGTMSQPMGDSNNQFAGALGVSAKYLQRAYRRIGDPRLAAMMVQSDQPFRRDLFEPYNADEIRRAAEEYAKPVGVHSAILEGLGYATLQTGNDENRSAVALYYGHYTAHAHFDRLNLEVYSYNHPLIPDFGYPETADSYDPRRYGWLSHSAVHNVVQVDATRQSWGPGELVCYQPGDEVQMVEARALTAYPQIALDDYRRAVMLVDIDESTAYCADFFHVEGGSQHDWLVHGPPADFSSEDIAFSEPRREGTLAGPDVPYGQFYDDPERINGEEGTRYWGYMGSAYQWLFNVQKASLDRTGIVRWDLNRDPELYPYKPTAGIGLRTHLLANDETVFACDGIPQRRKNFPDTHRWIVRRRAGENLMSTFATIFEPFNQSTPTIASVSPLAVEPQESATALKVEHATGTDVLLWTTQPDVAHEFAGFSVRARGACIRMDGDGNVTRVHVFDGTSLQGLGIEKTFAGPREATIVALDFDENTVTLDAPVLQPEDEETWIPVDTGDFIGAIQITKILSPTTLSLGDQDLRCGVGNVLGVADGTLETDQHLYFSHPGMLLVNEKGAVVCRIGAVEGHDIRPRRGEISSDDFPDTDSDGRRRFTVVAVGTGDTVTIPTRASLHL